MSVWSLFGIVIFAIWTAGVVKPPLKKILRKSYEWLAARSPKLAKAVDDFLQFVSDSYGPGNTGA